jgi:hypothetical protein
MTIQLKRASLAVALSVLAGTSFAKISARQ